MITKSSGSLLAGLLFILSWAIAAQAQQGFPRMLPPAPTSSRDVIVVNHESGDRLTDLSVRSLQGLVNRTTPTIWVGTDTSIGQSGWWRARLVEFGLINPPGPAISATVFLQSYKHFAKGVVIPPTDLGIDAYHVALARAAVDDLIVGTESMATTLGLPIVEDYRGRFATFAETLDYIHDHFIYTRKLSPTAFMYHRGDLASEIALVDYAVQQRLFTFTWHEGNFPEMWALERILAALPDNIPMLGAVGGGTGYSSEGKVIQLISRYGKFSLGSSGADNLSFRTGVEPLSQASLRQNRRPPPAYDPGKVYIAIQMSDGDNTNMWRRHLLRQGYWEKRGQIPLGWAMGAGTQDLLPTAVRYFYTSATEMDEFYQAISGLGYAWSGEFAEGGLDQGPAFSEQRREKAWTDFLYTAGAYMDLMDWKVSSSFHFEDRDDNLIGDETFSRYASGLPGCWAIFNGYGEVASLYGQLNRTTDGMPIFHAAIARSSGPVGSLRQDILTAAGATRPNFIMLFWLPFFLDLDWGIQELKSLPPEFEVVLPSELASLYREAKGLPTPPPWPIWVSPTPTPTLATPIPTLTPTPSLTPTPPDRVVPLTNSGFEMGNLTGWTRFYNNDGVYVTRAEFSISPIEGRWMFGGTHSLSGAGTRELIYQRPQVNPGDSLLFSAYLLTRTIDGPESSNYIRLAWDPAGGTNFQYGPPYSGNQWREDSVTFTASGEYVTIGIELNQLQNATWNHYFCDQTSLVRQLETPVPTPPEGPHLKAH